MDAMTTVALWVLLIAVRLGVLEPPSVAVKEAT
jgi:hypothetical protein